MLLLLGPRETLSGKFPGHAPEYLERYPAAPVTLPDPLPKGVDDLCRLVEAGHGTPEVYAALGDALLARGDKALAYRAFHLAQARGDVETRREMQERKDRCGYVAPAVIEEEKRLARVWVAALQEYERDRIRRGEDPRDLGPFYERYGRAEEDVAAVAQARRTTWGFAAGGVLLGIAALLGGALLIRRRRA